MMRHTERFRDGWLFRRGNAAGVEEFNFDDSDWQCVTVPHDWAIQGPFSSRYDAQFTKIVNNGETSELLHFGRTGGLPHSGEGVYRRFFDIDHTQAGKTFYLEFDGVMSHSEIFVNGEYAGGRPYGYSSFVLNVTKHVRVGAKNILCVKAVNPTDAARWYPGGGIYRNVRLVAVNETHVLPWGVWVRTLGINGSDADLELNVKSSSEKCTFAYRIISPCGKVVCEGESASSKAVCKVNSFSAWDVKSPLLYTAVIELKDESGRHTDTVNQKFGIRQVSFDYEKGMTLNGRRFVMNGVCMHHDLGPLGAAFSIPAARRQLEILSSIGVNSIRTSHNPPAPELLDLCDEMGFLVLDEAFDCWQMGKVKNDYHLHFDEWAERDLSDMIVRDRNHPCVIMWSIGNEILEQGADDGWKVAVMLRDIVHRTDPDRPVTAGLSFGDEALDKGMAAVIDVPGFNYKPHRYQEYHDRLPGRPIYGSETASTVSSRGEYYFPVKEKFMCHPGIQASSYDLEYPAWATTPDKEFHFQDKCKFVMGEFMWTGFDYLGEPCYDTAWPAHASYFGIFDLCGIPKDRAFLYKSRWTKENVLHLLPHWNWPNRIGEITPVHCYTSFETVELFLNGKSLGKKSKNGEYRLRWDDVVYEPGELKAVAYDKHGKPAMEAFRRTTSEPAAVKLMPENTKIKADGESLFFVRAGVYDISCELHPTASNRISFSVDGPAEFAGIANGDPTCIETFDQKHIHAFNGQALVILRSIKGKTGKITLRAEADHLASDSVVLETVADSAKLK